ncbi:MAG TPA: MarR family transcriptional regulator [Gaiellaceae bacterium]|jgi:DNA-binding MarR family transcriptional regulator
MANRSQPDAAPARTLAGELAPRLSRLVRLVREGQGVSRTQLSLLTSLRDAGPQRITALAASEHVTQPAMTTLVSRLEREEWVVRQADPSDRRAVQVVLTAEGREALAGLTAAAVDRLAGRIAALTPAERKRLEASLPLIDRLLETERRGAK